MLEKQIEAAVCKYAKSKGVLAYKFSSPNHIGVPDRIFFAPGGKVFLIEFKRGGGKATPMQLREADRLATVGTSVYFVDDVDTGKGIVDLELSCVR